MAYRIKKSDEDIQAALRRIADEQIGRALREIGDEGLEIGKRVHQVRKRCKKVRALIRLVRPAFKDYSDENEVFRDVARTLAPLRDADVRVQTYDDVTDHFADQIDRRAFASIRARLSRAAQRLREDPETLANLRAAEARLADARGRAGGWTLKTSGFDAVAGGLGKTYGRARKGMDRAFGHHHDDELLHAWRKQLKHHWYHTRLLQPINPAMMTPREELADELGELLGDHHDLAELDRCLLGAPGEFGSEKDVEAFRALLHRRQGDLEARAFRLAPLLLAERRKPLDKRWKKDWKLFRVGKWRPEQMLAKA